MCNAWNHRRGCTCGWGGGYSGGSSNGLLNTLSLLKKQQFAQISEIKNVYESYVNPNASCPVCGEHVFFYQSPYGGRVFFEQLSPPWPKHPCTDNSSTPKPITGGNWTSKQVKIYKENWEPFIIESVAKEDQISCKIVGECLGQVLTVFVSKAMISNSSENLLSENTIANIKEENGSYRLSFLLIKGQPFEIRAFKTRKLF